MANIVGPLIRSARTGAGMTQEQLAAKIEGISAADISKAERGEKELTQSVLKQIAKATGVTQSSLVEAARESTYGTAEKEKGKEPSKAKESSKTKESEKEKNQKTTASANTVQVTAAEKKLLELYRAADSETKKAALKVLKGEKDGDTGSDVLNTLLGALEFLGGGKEK